MSGRRSKQDSPYLERSKELRELLLRQRVEVLKISRKELSLRAGVSQGTIQAIEKGQVTEPGLFTINSLGVALQLDLGGMMSSISGPIRAKALHPSANRLGSSSASDGE